MKRKTIGRVKAMRLAPVAAPADLSVVLPGDHVRVWRGFYWHHAVYAGDGWLIEFGSSAFGGRVAHVEWGDFARGCSVNRVGRGGQAAVQRADSQLGRSDFDLMTRNCEHFASWCATGQWESAQIAFVGFGAVVAALFFAVSKRAA